MSEAPDWERVKETLADALELERGQRAAFLDEACAQDSALRVEVERLLPGEETEERFLITPPRIPPMRRLLEPGDLLGGFTLGRLLGTGGMGRVYEATQERPHRTVALKVLHPFSLPAGAERRFEWEAEALARLDHPVVARVIDAGTEVSESGIPISWFAMELIDGAPLLEAADAQRLDRRARLELFAEICDGVAHAHRRGVIHRDLKPENILVDDHGAPHIVDFGISRALDPLGTAMTQAGEVLGTLAYMAPEQLRGEPHAIDARADIWALGVLLHRLLTGRAPIELEGVPLPEIVRRVTEAEAPKAGRSDPSLRGDLETILATALALEPEQRYAGVDQLGADVRRHLADEPITARPASALYQLGKLARRHRGLVSLLALSLVLLLVAIAGTSLGLVRASRARQEAERERDRALAVGELVDRMFASVDYEQDGRDVRVAELLDSAGAELAADGGLDPAVRASLHRTLGSSYEGLGLYDEAQRHLGIAVELFDAAGEANADLTLATLADRSRALFAMDDVEGAAEAQARFDERAAALDPIPSWVKIRAAQLEAERLFGEGDRRGQVQKLREVCAAYRALPPEEAARAEDLDEARNGLADALLYLNESTEAEALLRETAQAGIERLGAAHPRAITYQANLATSLDGIGRSLEAVEMFEPLLPLALATWGADHADTGSLRNNYACALSSVGRHEEALAIFEERLAGVLERYGPDHRLARMSWNNVAAQAMSLGRFALAEEELRAALASHARVLGDQDPYGQLGLEANLVAALEGQERFSEAEAVSSRVLAGWEQLYGAEHPQTIIARNNHAMLLVEAGRGPEALPYAERNLALSREHLPDYAWNAFPLRSNLGRALSAAGRHADAIAELEAVAAILRDDPGVPESSRTRCGELLERARRAQSGSTEELD